jgi:hypothetical protein
VHVARSYHAPSGGNGDLWLFEIFIAKSHRTQHGAIGCTVITVYHN